MDKALTQELALVLQKKYDIYFCTSDMMVLDGCVRIPVEVHDPISDMAWFTQTVEKFGYRVITENDQDDNLKLYLQSLSSGHRTNAYLKWWWEILLGFLFIGFFMVALYLLLLKLRS